MREITVQGQLTELYREKRLRERLYPRWIAQGTLTPRQAAWQLAVLESLITEKKAQLAAEQVEPAQRTLMEVPHE